VVLKSYGKNACELCGARRFPFVDGGSELCAYSAHMTLISHATDYSVGQCLLSWRLLCDFHRCVVPHIWH
jgi:hypothetical protein